MNRATHTTLFNAPQPLEHYAGEIILWSATYAWSRFGFMPNFGLRIVNMESRRTCLPLVAIGCLIASGCFFEPAINWDDRFCDPAKRTLTITAFKLIDNQVAAAPLDEKQTKAVKGRNYAIAKKNDLDALYKVLCNSNVPFGATNARGSHHISINFSCTFSDGEVLQNVADLYLFGDRTYLNICCGSDGGFQGGYFRVARLDAVLSAQTLAELRKEFLGTEEPTNYPKDFKLP